MMELTISKISHQKHPCIIAGDVNNYYDLLTVAVGYMY